MNLIEFQTRNVVAWLDWPSDGKMDLYCTCITWYRITRPTTNNWKQWRRNEIASSNARKRFCANIPRRGLHTDVADLDDDDEHTQFELSTSNIRNRSNYLTNCQWGRDYKRISIYLHMFPAQGYPQTSLSRENAVQLPRGGYVDDK